VKQHQDVCIPRRFVFTYVFESLLLIGVVIVQKISHSFGSMLDVIDQFDRERFDMLRLCV